MLSRRIVVLCFCLILLVMGCTDSGHVAPVTEGWHQPNRVQGAHTVARGETLYAIAWRYGHDFRQLAAINGIQAPYHLHAGQQIRLSMAGLSPAASVVTVTETEPPSPPAQQISPARQRKPAKKTRDVASRDNTWVPPETSQLKRIKHWSWPTKGNIVRQFGQHNKGIDISGKPGQPIRAAAAGVVVYCGSGIRGYGKLIIIKHSDDYLSAYAFNRKLLVKQGKLVRSGQKIALMGLGNYHRPILHFEIRRVGKPVDPLNYLRR